MTEIVPVLLAGGSGARLWPVSRKSCPKQFSELIGETTLFQISAQRLTSSELIRFTPHITLTNSEYRFIVLEQFQRIGINPGHIFIEPEAKNTSPAILAASLFALSMDENVILLVAPSDHVISDTEYFHEMINVGLSHVQNQKIVTFGISPTHPETGYGYLELSPDSLDHTGTTELLRFVEKPNLQNARQMLAAGHCLWNAGIFLFRARDMVDAFESLAPETLDLVSKSLSDGSTDSGFLRLSSEHWSKLEDISIDRAIMEKATNLVAVPFKSYWSDLGGWEAVWSESKPDKSGNVTSENVHLVECSNSLLRSESDSQHVVGIGLHDIMAIAMPDAVLVAHKERAQDVKIAVELLMADNIPQAEMFTKDQRPWGWFERIASGNNFQVKRIYVKPSGALSLQSHMRRAEHWVVVEGVGEITIEDEVQLVNQGQSVFIPLGAKHRLKNPSKLPLILIEVQIGDYLGEDDIIRYEDLYARS
jgi:mannose-1-phosphate guanylyltransferase/mannose-6-phosphate isomerase